MIKRYLNKYTGKVTMLVAIMNTLYGSSRSYVKINDAVVQT